MTADTPLRSPHVAFNWGALIGSLGRLIGLGRAECRLPVLAGIFLFRIHDAITINLLVTLVFPSFVLMGHDALFKPAGATGLPLAAAVVLGFLAGNVIGLSSRMLGASTP